MTASINYRLLAPNGCIGAGTIPPECYSAAIEATHDAQAAVRWFRVNARKYRIDRRRIGIGGSPPGRSSPAESARSRRARGEWQPGPAVVGRRLRLDLGRSTGRAVRRPEHLAGILFASVDDRLVPSQWSVDTYDELTSPGIPSRLTTFPGEVHVPFAEHGTEITDQTTQFLYGQLDLRHSKPEPPRHN